MRTGVRIKSKLKRNSAYRRSGKRFFNVRTKKYYSYNNMLWLLNILPFMERQFSSSNLVDSIIIIESLPEDESQSGLVLSRDILELECTLNSLALTHFDCNNKAEFFAFFDRLKTSLKENNGDVISSSANYPILHFEIHGSEEKDGLILKDGSFIEWKVLRNLFREINLIMNNNLIVVMAVCNGYWVTPGILPSKCTPFYTLVAPPNPISVGSVKKIFPQFYKELFQTGDLMSGYNKVKDKCALYHCEMIFIRVMARYFAEQCTGTAKDIRINNLVSIAKSKYPQLDEKILAQICEEEIKPSEKIVNKYKRIFLQDKTPDNSDRFNIKYQDVLDYMENYQ